MGYVETVLQPGEIVRFQTNRHWIGFLPGGALLVLALVLYVAGGDAFYGVWNLLALVLLVVGVILLARAWYLRWITEIAVTDRRVIYKAGFISRSTDEMPLGKVENIEVVQSIPGRILGYGNVDVKGTGAGGIGADKLFRIADPLGFRNTVMAGESYTPAPVRTPRPTVEEAPLATPAAARAATAAPAAAAAAVSEAPSPVSVDTPELDEKPAAAAPAPASATASTEPASPEAASREPAPAAGAGAAATTSER
ncbi:membrane-flanked domain protein [Rhodovulum sp. PH10]|uniref:PH domain-containing protein n=1 Tax=Rhodovulum sp. PH10 TaxID=1187851 RepID=UPI00027C243A|nr:PH domain-containing protein [Rhodovulum sp. PH10]EJW09256.1 membrane-flanked domain protein [Rhodovulum sp. PH10]